MSTDPTARLTPYELVFGAESIDDRLFPPIAEEAEARNMPLFDPERFLFLSSVGRLLQGLAGDPTAPEEAAGGDSARVSPEAPEAPAGLGAPEASEASREEEGRKGSGRKGSGPEGSGREEIRQYGRLLYHAFHLWRAGKPLLLLTVDAARWLLDDVTSVGGWRLRPPAPSGYVQLPRQLVWAAPARGMTPEPVDGFFWSFVQGDDRPDSGSPDTLHVLLALGLRPDRPGFSVVPATGELDTVEHWAEVEGRSDGTDFETTLPGGEQDRLYSLETPAEILKLASRVFWQVDASPEALSSEQRVEASRAGSVADVGFEGRSAPEEEGASQYGMPPSALPYRTIRGRG